MQLLCSLGKQDCITAKDPCPPRPFLYLRETKSWWCEGDGEGEEKCLFWTILGGEERLESI